jgi:pimeloyl-ACP methyl ester carboxylesterase
VACKRMFGGPVKWLSLLVVVVICISPIVSVYASSESDKAVHTKELNIVFLHGMGGSSCSFQLLTDWITKRIEAYILVYEQSNPGIKIKFNMLSRCYPGYADIKTWANNVADSINQHFGNKNNLILIGHSMGGKTALYTVAHDIGGLADRVSTVVTINSPIKSLSRYYAPGGGSPLSYCRTGLLGTDQGVCSSVTSYDSSKDGAWVAQNKHWLALISGEGAPMSTQFDRGGVDVWPRDIDDGVVPISAQYSDGADVIYYGEYAHSTLGVSDEIAQYIADRIIRYVFGLSVECCVFSRSGTIEHDADWLLGKDKWNDMVGEVFAASGTLRHTNTSFTKWEKWDDVIGEAVLQTQRSHAQIQQLSLPILTRIQGAKWLDTNNLQDGRLSLQTSAAPRTSVELKWSIYDRGLLPEGTKRAYYEVSIKDGTPLTAIGEVSWTSVDVRDIRLLISSEAHSPFRWFKAEWRVFKLESRQKGIIDEIPTID